MPPSQRPKAQIVIGGKVEHDLPAYVQTAIGQPFGGA